MGKGAQIAERQVRAMQYQQNLYAPAAWNPKNPMLLSFTKRLKRQSQCLKKQRDPAQ